MEVEVDTKDAHKKMAVPMDAVSDNPPTPDEYLELVWADAVPSAATVTAALDKRERMKLNGRFKTYCRVGVGHPGVLWGTAPGQGHRVALVLKSWHQEGPAAEGTTVRRGADKIGGEFHYLMLVRATPCPHMLHRAVQPCPHSVKWHAP